MARKTKPRKKKSLPTVDRQSILAAFKSAGKPMRRMELLRYMKLHKKFKRDLKLLLRELVVEGKLIKTRGGTFGLADSMRMVTGKLEVQRSGVGFVIPEDARRKDVFIPRSAMGDAWNGDKVMAAVIPARGKGKNPEGRIVRVLERARDILAVRVERRMGPGLFLARPTDPKLAFSVMTDTAELPTQPEPGDIMYAEAGERLEHRLWAARATENLGDEEDVAVQEKLVKVAHGVPRSFPSDVLAEAGALPEVPDEADFAGRRDLRELPLVTIDGAKARDFDDAVHVAQEKNGWRLTVAIADVSHYVPTGSALDKEAYKRGNSYYFPRSVEPMFPEALSNGLCSLNPEVPRLAMVAEIFFGKDGQPGPAEFYPAVIRSHARLTYMQVHRILEQGDEEERRAVGDLVGHLEEAERLARVLHRVRTERGSLDFDLPEPEIHFNIYGETEDITPRPRVFAHQMIEEFMVAANEAVARFLEDGEIPCPYRVHPEPDGDKLRQVFKVLSRTDIAAQVPTRGAVTPSALQDLLDAAAGTELEFLAGRLVLRSMMQAEYSPGNIGHFGLASESYAHFTSPIRRYADLLVHRALKFAIGASDKPPLSIGRLGEACKHISGRERIAMEAEREILKRLTVLFLADRVGEVFTGVVNGVSDYGFWVELNEVMAEGMVRLSNMSDDYYNLFPERQELVGERTGKRYRLGQAVRVQLFSVSLARLEVDLEVMDDEMI